MYSYLGQIIIRDKYMKVLHLNTSEDGGAARAAMRIHDGLLRNGIDSWFGVQAKTSAKNRVITTTGKINKIKRKINERSEGLIRRLLNVKMETPWSINRIFFDDIYNNILDENIDVYHLHWINGGFLSINCIAKLKKPIVWTLHDEWPFTGGCHYVSDNCSKFCKGCFKCDQVKGNSVVDLAKRGFSSKEEKYPKNMTIVGPSRWIAEEAAKSALFANYKIKVIPNGIDINVFKPVNKNFARDVLNLNKDSKIILFGAMAATFDKRKGFQYLYPAIKLLFDKYHNNNIEVVVFGSDIPKNPPDFGFNVTYTGRLFDDISLSVLYSAADVMVVPSHADNLPNTVMEAMACGTPCVGFDIGGIPDLIISKENGYLAKHYEIEDLSRGIEYILLNEQWEKLSKAARIKVENSYSLDIIAKRYINLYKEIINQ